MLPRVAIPCCSCSRTTEAITAPHKTPTRAPLRAGSILRVLVRAAYLLRSTVMRQLRRALSSLHCALLSHSPTELKAQDCAADLQTKKPVDGRTNYSNVCKPGKKLHLTGEENPSPHAAPAMHGAAAPPRQYSTRGSFHLESSLPHSPNCPTMEHKVSEPPALPTGTELSSPPALAAVAAVRRHSLAWASAHDLPAAADCWYIICTVHQRFARPGRNDVKRRVAGLRMAAAASSNLLEAGLCGAVLL